MLVVRYSHSFQMEALERCTFYFFKCLMSCWQWIWGVDFCEVSKRVTAMTQDLATSQGSKFKLWHRKSSFRHSCATIKSSGAGFSCVHLVSNPGYWVLNCRVTVEWCIGKDLEGKNYGLIKVLSGIFQEGLIKAMITSIRIDDDCLKIWTSCIPYTSLNHWCYTNPFGTSVIFMCVIPVVCN